MSDNSKSVELLNPCHPGELLREGIAEQGRTVTEAAKLLNVSRATLHRLLAGEGSMTATLAVRLEQLEWSTARMWLALQAQFDIARAKREADAA